MMKKLALSLALGGSCAFAFANTITYTLSGVITASPTDAIEVGSAFSFIASIDSGTSPDWAPSAGRYEWAMMTNSDLTIGASTVGVDPASGAVALDEHTVPGKNSFLLNEYSPDAPTTALPTSASLNGIRIYDVTVALSNSAASVTPFQATPAPTTFLGSLSDWSYRQLSFETFSQDILTSTGDYAYLGDVSGEITSISVSSPSPVPEPLNISLFTLGFVAVGAIGRRERRRSAAPN